MSPPTNGRFCSSSSSTGTVPKSNSRMNGGQRSNGVSSVPLSGSGGAQASAAAATSNENSLTLRQQSQQLERLLLEQQAKLRESQPKNETTSASASSQQVLDPDFMAESLRDLREKLQLLQSLNMEQNQRYEFHSIPTLGPVQYDIDNQEMFNSLRRDIQNQWHFLEKKQQFHPRSFHDPMRDREMEQLRSENNGLKASLHQQQSQIHQLTHSLNQCFQAVLAIQRDVSNLQQQSEQLQKNSTSTHASLEDNLDSVSQQRDFESHPSSSWEFDFAHHHHHHVVPTSRSIDPWNNYFSTPDSRMMPIGGSESGASMTGTSAASGALNNTVPPGIRANNYWDNFRSFSRQNRLSSNNLGLGSPVVAQVTPRQVPQLHLPHSPFRANNSNNSTDQLLDNAVLVEPYFQQSSSSTRPRRKQKINREQNVSSSGVTGRPRGEATMVFPMPQSTQNQPQQAVQQPRQNEVQPMVHHQMQNPVVTSIKRSIYSHVNDLIAQNEERPELLARIYHNLQGIDRVSVSIASSMPPTLDSTTDVTTEALSNLNMSTTSSSRLRPWPTSMYEAAVGDETSEDETGNFFKNKRLNATIGIATTTTSSLHENPPPLVTASVAGAANSSGASSIIASQDDDRLYLMDDGLASLGAVGLAVEAGKKINEDKNVVAVPKNIQRNIISRERDTRKIRREKPRNMMQNEHEAAGFVPVVKFQHNELSSSGAAVTAADNDIDQNDMAEADQQATSSMGNTDSIEPSLELDRVPTRLSSTELERRQQDEEELQNLVEEVLNSTSSEVDFVVGRSDQIPSPK